MSEPNSALTYQDLILAVAERLGVAFYGASGDQAAQIPDSVTMPYELDRCKRFVQDGIRMFINDAPPAGWRWQRPLAEVDLWPDKGLAMPSSSTGANVVTAVWNPGGDNKTHVYATAAWFSASSVNQVLAVRNVGVFTIKGYVSPTEVTLTPGTDYSWPGSAVFNLDDPTSQPTVTVAYNGVGTNLSTITTTTAATFYPTSENKTLYVTDMAAPITLGTYLTDKTMEFVDAGGAIATLWGAGARTFSLTAFGVYSLPQNFGGEYNGEITYAAGSNRGVPINWISELEIRRLRENWNMVSGNPYYAAIRRMPEGTNRRYELLIYPNTGGTYRVEFPYTIYFDEITALTDMHPAGFAFDETIRAACLAAAEIGGEDALAGSVKYYRDICLPNAYRADARNAPRKLGYCSNPRSQTVALRDFRQYFRRPTVSYRS
jgi:hypothetical protein